MSGTSKRGGVRVSLLRLAVAAGVECMESELGGGFAK